MKTVKFKFTGVSPILFHNVNCMDLVKPKAMSHADFEKSQEMLEARLYLGEDQALILPPRVIIGAIREAARVSGIKQDKKRSTYAGIVRAVVFCMDPALFKEQLSDVVTHSEYVTIMRSKVLRIFPMLKKWEVTVTLNYDETQMPLEALEEILEHCGRYCGFGDYRPQYGRFEVSRVK